MPHTNMFPVVLFTTVKYWEDVRSGNREMVKEIIPHWYDILTAITNNMYEESGIIRKI